MLGLIFIDCMFAFTILFITFQLIKNKDTFKCDVCGRRYSITKNNYYIVDEGITCCHCHKYYK